MLNKVKHPPQPHPIPVYALNSKYLGLMYKEYFNKVLFYENNSIVSI